MLVFCLGMLPSIVQISKFLYFHVERTVSCVYFCSRHHEVQCTYSLMVHSAPATGQGSNFPHFRRKLEHKRHYWIFLTYLGFKCKSCKFKFNKLPLVSFTCFNNAPRLFFKTLYRQHYTCTCTLLAARHSNLWFIWLPNRSIKLQCMLCKELACVFNSHAYETI